MWGHGGLYGDWACYLEAWAADRRPLPHRPPTLSAQDFDSDTWNRLMMRVQEAINDRLQSWNTALGRHLAESVDEFSWGRALAQSRDGLRPILELCAAAEFPAEVREALTRQVHGVIQSNQQTLEADASRELRGPNRRSAEIQLRQLRQNPLTAVLTAAPVTSPPPPPPSPTPLGDSSSPSSGPRRRIIIDSGGDR